MSTAFSSSVNLRTVPGNRYMTQVSLTGPTSYTTGGIAYTPQLFGFDFNVDFLVIGSTSNGMLGSWDRANQKIKLRYPTGGASAPGSVGAPAVAAPSLSGALTAGSLSGAPALGTLGGTATPASGSTAMQSTSAQPAIPLTITGAPGIGTLAQGAPGLGTLAAAAPALTAGQGLEVSNGTDVSSVVLEVLAFGY